MLRSNRILSLILLAGLVLPTGIIAMDSSDNESDDGDRRMTLADHRRNRHDRNREVSFFVRHPHFWTAVRYGTPVALTAGVLGVGVAIGRRQARASTSSAPQIGPQQNPDTTLALTPAGAPARRGPLALLKSGGQLMWSGGQLLGKGIVALASTLFLAKEAGVNVGAIFSSLNFLWHVQGYNQRGRIEDITGDTNDRVVDLADDHLVMDARNQRIEEMSAWMQGQLGMTAGEVSQILQVVVDPETGHAALADQLIDINGNIVVIGQRFGRYGSRFGALERSLGGLFEAVNDPELGLPRAHQRLMAIEETTGTIVTRADVIAATQTEHTATLDEHGQQLTRLERDLKDARAKLKRVDDNVTGIAEQLDTTTASIRESQDSIEEQLAAIRRENEALREQLARVPATTDDTNERVRALQETLAALQATVEAQKAQVDDLHRRHGGGGSSSSAAQ